VLFSTKCRSFCNLIFFCPNNHVFHKHSQKFKYQTGCLKVKDLTVNIINRIGLRDFTLPVRLSKLFSSVWPCQAGTWPLVKVKAPADWWVMMMWQYKWINACFSVAVQLHESEGSGPWGNPGFPERGYSRGIQEREEHCKLCMNCAILRANTKFVGAQHKVPIETWLLELWCSSQFVCWLYNLIYVGHWVPMSFTCVAYILNIKNVFRPNIPYWLSYHMSIYTFLQVRNSQIVGN